MSVRSTATKAAFDVLTRVGRVSPAAGDPEESVRVRVLGGPLRGNTLAMTKPARPAYILGSYDRPIRQSMEDSIDRGATVIDIGAHIGFQTLALARHVGPGGEVHAFEADRTTHQLLSANVAASEVADWTTTHLLAATATSGPVEFASFEYSLVSHVTDGEHAPDAIVDVVDGVSIDDFVYERGNTPPNLIKITITMGEADVLRGARRTIETERPTIVVLTTDESRPPVIELMGEHGYRPEILLEKGVLQYLRFHLPK